MAKRSNNAVWMLLVILAVCFQVVFVFADSRPSATGTAIDFCKAYLLLDTDMEQYMSSDLIGDEEQGSPVAAYIQAMSDDAHARGFKIDMLRQTIDHVEAETLAQDAESATIQLTGESRTCINPVFAYVAKLFRLGQRRHFETTLKLVKQDGKWKVSGVPYGMFRNV
jgi:hypothetical protein